MPAEYGLLTLYLVELKNYPVASVANKTIMSIFFCCVVFSSFILFPFPFSSFLILASSGGDIQVFVQVRNQTFWKSDLFCACVSMVVPTTGMEDTYSIFNETWPSPAQKVGVIELGTIFLERGAGVTESKILTYVYTHAY